MPMTIHECPQNKQYHPIYSDGLLYFLAPPGGPDIIIMFCPFCGIKLERGKPGRKKKEIDHASGRSAKCANLDANSVSRTNIANSIVPNQK